MIRLLQISLLLMLGLLSISANALSIPSNITEWAKNLQTHLPGVLQLVIAVSYVIGLAMIVSGVLKLKAYGQQTVFMSTHASLAGPLVSIIIGLVLFYTPTVLDTMIYTFWAYGTSGGSFIEYPSDVGEDLWGLLDPAVAIVRIVGYIAFIRGWLMLARMGGQGSQPGTLSKALAHIIGGVLAVNIVGTWHLLQNTIGIAKF